MKLLSLLAGTVCLRPYVFIFLGCYLIVAIRHLGLGRALAFLTLGYLISWLAELCSIHTGFPFGIYIYIPATIHQELWVAGVPFMDSISYVFLAYASYTLALLALARAPWQGGEDQILSSSWRATILAATLMMILDVIIDPVALRGYRWFLGQIYGYPSPGIYFGIPLSNFAGWWLVALVMVRLLQYLKRLPDSPFLTRGRGPLPGQPFLGPGLYLGILAFNLTMTFWIGETLLGLVGLFIYTPFLTWLALKLSER